MGVFAGVILLKNAQVFKIGASPTITPKDVRVGSVSDSSATVSWVTDDQTTAFINYGAGQDTEMIAYETVDDQKFFTHSVTITGLSPETNYYFKINSNGTTYDNNGVAWQFSTGKSLPMSQVSIPISGSVITASGQSEKRAIVYVTVNGYVVSTLTSDSGIFVLQLGSVRTTDLFSYAEIDPAKTLLEISVTTEKGETATAKIFPQSANPIPPLIIGQDQDFRNLQPTGVGQNPDANLDLPETATIESKLDVTGSKASPSKTVTLDSLNDGEVVTSDKPEFFGNGPTGNKITITVHSDTTVTGTTTVSSKGSWSWSPPTNLSEGTHTITVSWVDTSGITRTLTRSFVVQAGELPAFVATPTATPTLRPLSTKSPTPTPIPTKSPIPTASPVAVLTKSPSPTPKATRTPTGTPAALPQSGSLTPTVLLFMMGLGILTFSFYTWKTSKNN